MALQVTHVAAPAVGTEWRYVVPAQWVLDVVAVTATLTTTAAPTGSTDQTGNGNTLAYNPVMFPHETFGVPGPFGAGGGAAVDCSAYDSLTNNTLGQAGNAGGGFDVATFSFEMVVWGLATGNITQIGMGIYNTVANTVRCAMGFDRGINGLRGINTNGPDFSLGGFAASAGWGHGVVTYDGAQWVGYNNGVANAPVAGHAPTVTIVTKPLYVMGDGRSSQGTNAKVAAAAYYSGALSAAQVSAHQAAIATSAAAYQAAVLADTPLAFWMLADTYVGGARQAVLEVTDGTSKVGDYPGLANSGTGMIFVYTWASQAPSSAMSPDGATNFIQIPDLILPGGYTLGSVTPAMKTTDQWSNIAIWWDDAQSVTPGGPGGGNPGDFSPVILLPSDWQGFP